MERKEFLHEPAHIKGLWIVLEKLSLKKKSVFIHFVFALFVCFWAPQAKVQLAPLCWREGKVKNSNQLHPR